jgi:hypothetical protein
MCAQPHTSVAAVRAGTVGGAVVGGARRVRCGSPRGSDPRRGGTWVRLRTQGILVCGFVLPLTDQ